jgi:mono/diheme cytochrome c family protein/plastocyanin
LDFHFEMRNELFALIVVILILVAFPISLFVYQAWRTSARDARMIELIANVPNKGGWSPDTIRVNVGERVRLRISSPDVVHGFAIPALGIQADEILPGHVAEIEFTATRAGRFPFACTRWCSVDHWRMRGIIEVIDSANPQPWLPTVIPPLYQQLGIDIDAPHSAQNVPLQKPSAARGALLNLMIADDLRVKSPSEVFATLRGDPALKAYRDDELWDAIAFAWKQNVGAEALARGQKLYARDCAACHGETGKGDGPAGRNLPGLAAMDAMLKRGPADFTDASHMLGASDILLQDKILRGGMGTGMPEWRTLYTDDELWAVVSYLRSFVFEYR